MRKRKVKKWCSAILAAVMVVALIPVTVFAAGSECPNGNGCTEHAAAIGDVHYDTLQAAIDDADSGEEIRLLKNVEESGVTFKKEGTYTLDLNEKILSTTAVTSEIIALKTPNLNLNIKNGRMEAEASDTYGIYAYSNGGTAPAGDYANLNLTLDGVTIDCVDQPVGVQGNNSNQNVTIKNSVITCDTTGVYFPPKSGKLIIDNSQITALNNGIVAKGGEVEIIGENTVIRATGTPEESDKPYDGNVTGQGFPKTGSAIYVEGNYKIGNQARPINIDIKDGKIESDKGASVAVNYLQDQSVQKTEIEGGVFSSDVMQFVTDNSTAASLTSGDKSIYYVGNPETVAERVASDAEAGNSIVVKKGNASFTNLPDDITVTNEGGGNVTANGEAVTDLPVDTHTHMWGEPTWNWAEDSGSAEAVFVCAKDSSHRQAVGASVTKETIAAGCIVEGKVIYSAKAEFNGKTYTNEKIVIVPAVGKHGEMELKNVKEASCTQEGYTGDKVCAVCGETIEQGQVLPKLSHIYKDGQCTVCGEADPDYQGSGANEDNADAPQTGGGSHLGIWIAALLVSTGGLAGIVLFAKKRKEQ